MGNQNRRNDPGIERHPLLFTVVLPASIFFVIAIWSSPLMYNNLAEWLESWQTILFSHVCHQFPDRSWHIQGIPLPVCSRCTGIYNGLFAGLVVFSLFSAFVNRFKYYFVRMFLFSSLILILDGIANFIGIWQSVDYIRTLIGFLGGMMTGSVLIHALLIPRKSQ